MALLRKGIKNLSQLVIDADKDWQVKGITNIKQIAAAMAKGDLAVRGDAVLQRLVPSTLGLVLTSAGTGHIPVWMPGSAMEVWIPLVLEGALATDKVVPDHDVNFPAPFTSPLFKTIGDAPLDWIKLIGPQASVVPTLTKETVDKNIAITPTAPDTTMIYGMFVDGAVADDGGVQTDETANAWSLADDDMTLMAALPVVNDAYYLGCLYKAHQFWVNTTTPGVGNWGLAHEYWNGGAWVNCVDLLDNTLEWTVSGWKSIDHTPQAGWALLNIAGHNLYWIRARVAAFNNINTQPLGGQAKAVFTI